MRMHKFRNERVSYNKKFMKKNYMLNFIYVFPFFWLRLQQTEVISEIYFYFLYRFRFWYNVFVYCQVMFENASERVYEDDTEYKFNEKVWRSELNSIKQSVNRIIHAHAIEFLNNPFTYISTSFFVEACRENFHFWKEVIPVLFKEVYCSFLEVFMSFYTGHDIEKFRAYFNIEEEEEEEVESELEEDASVQDDLRVRIEKKESTEQKHL